MPLIPGQMVHGRYRVVTLLSQGGMGAVYEVMDTTLNVRCALKEMIPYPGTQGSALPELREQFQQEAQLLAGLRHSNLPRVSDHFEEDGNAYLVMDFVHGRRLDEVIAQEGKLPEEEVLGWARQLIEALAHCHERGVIHRDVKPQNVIITWQGQAVLVDFGLAKLVDPSDPRTRTVMRGMGTPEYAPPEQYDTKQGRTDARTDIYSLGATLYHALVGAPPPTVAERVVNPESLAPARELRDDIGEVTDQVLTKAMALQPSHRFQNVAEMHQALFASPLPSQVKAESTASPGTDTTMLPSPLKSGGFLRWIGAARLRVDRRLGVSLLAVGFVSLVTVVSLLAGNVNGGGIPTATATSTALVVTTSTSTPTASPSPTVTPTASPTSRPSGQQPTGTPKSSSLPPIPFLTPFPVSLTITPTAAYTLSPTPLRPRPTSTPVSTPMPAPTDTPKPEAPQPPPTVLPTTPPTTPSTIPPTTPPTVPPTPRPTPGPS